MKKRIVTVITVILTAICFFGCGTSEKCRICSEDVFKDGYCKEHYFKNLAESLVGGLFAEIRDTVGTALSGTFGSDTPGTDPISGILGGEFGNLTDILDSFGGGEDSAAFDSLKEKAQDFLDNEINPDDDEETVKEKIKEALGSVTDNMGEEFEGLNESETEELRNAIDEFLKTL